jgi:subtilisin family serine protease
LVAALSGYAGLSDAAPVADDTAISVGKTVGYAKGRLLAAPRAGVSEKELAKALKSVNAKSKGRFSQGNIHVIELPPGIDEIKAMHLMQKNPAWKFVELDMAVTHDATVSDPSYSSSWALPKIVAPTAWDTANGSGITIAILDSGVDSAHPDLKANLVPGWNMVENNSNTSDVNGHGSKVAGAAAMVANNGNGSAGVAWGARIMPVRISNADGYAYWSTVAQGINWAADKGAKVANVSFNGVSGSSTVKSAADYMRSKGGVVVASAGNTSGFQSYPASDSILVAAATDSGDNRTSWSSYGAYVDVAAPGASIYSTVNGGGYANVSGTSFSSPITAATVALMMSANPKLSPADVNKIITSTALDRGTAGFDQYYGHGRIDAAKAVATAKTYAGTGTTTTTTTPTTDTGSTGSTGTSADTQAPTIGITSPTGGSKVSGLVAVDVNYSDNAGVTRAELWVNGTKVATDTTSPFAFAWDTATYADGSHALAAKAYDAAGNVGTSSSVSVSLANDTTAPVVSSLSLTDGMTISPAKQAVSASATDNQKVAKTSLTIDGKEVAIAYGSSLSYSWNTRKVAKGSHAVTVRAWDAAGNTTSKSVTVYK